MTEYSSSADFGSGIADTSSPLGAGSNASRFTFNSGRAAYSSTSNTRDSVRAFSSCEPSSVIRFRSTLGRRDSRRIASFSRATFCASTPSCSRSSAVIACVIPEFPVCSTSSSDRALLRSTYASAASGRFRSNCSCTICRYACVWSSMNRITPCRSPGSSRRNSSISPIASLKTDSASTGFSCSRSDTPTRSSALISVSLSPDNRANAAAVCPSCSAIAYRPSASAICPSTIRALFASAVSPMLSANLIVASSFSRAGPNWLAWNCRFP